MSWFKRKQNPNVSQVEPSMRLIENDADTFDGQTLEDNGQYVVDPATRVTGTVEIEPATVEVAPATESAALEGSAEISFAPDSAEASLAPAPASVAPASEKGTDLAPADVAAPAVKPEGRFAKLKSRLKRAPAEHAEEAPESTESADAGVASDSADASVTDAPAVPGQPSQMSKLKAITSRAKNRGEKPKFLAVPVRVVIGYLPEVTERDALEYAVGLAEKHFEQIGMSYFDAFKYGSGYAFEAHEGGSGKAYVPEIIRYFDSKGLFRPGEDVKAVIRTATRAVEVQRTREGLAAIILPERDETPPSDWLQPTGKMQPAIHKRTGFLMVGAALFTTGFIAMIFTSMLTRFQEYEAAPDPVVQRIDISQLPNQKWSELAATPADKIVRALRYRHNRWEPPELVAAPVAAAVSAPPAPGASSPPATVVPPPPSIGATQFPSTTNPGAAR
jgi:hypothetical protein